VPWRGDADDVVAEQQPSGAPTPETAPWTCGLAAAAPAELSYGALRPRVFDQGERWVDRAGESVRLADLPLRELSRLIGLLTENAEHFYISAMQRSSLTILGEAALGRPGAELLAASLGDRLDALTPREWLEATTLMRSLRTQVASRRGSKS
jgi:hypothetical protein